MADPQSPNRVETNGEHSPSQEHFKKVDNVSSKEVREASVGQVAYREALGFDESAETTGKVSEVLSDQKDVKGDGPAAGGATAQKVVDPEEIRAQLLKNLPSENVMKRQIEREIRKEVAYLHKKAMKMFAAPGGMSFFEMNNLVKKIRELKGLLAELLKASLESLKTLWLRFVHGVL